MMLLGDSKDEPWRDGLRKAKTMRVEIARALL